MALTARLRTRLGARVPRLSGSVAGTFLVGYAVLLLCLPSQLVFPPLGAPGTPANMWALAGLVWWCCVTLAGLNPVRGLTPTRVVVVLLSTVVLASYANGMISGWYAPPDVRQSTDEFWTLVPQTVDEITTVMISAGDRGLLSFAGWMGVVLIASEGLRTWAALERLVTVLVWLGAFVASLGILSFFTGFDPVPYLRIPGFSTNSDLQGVLTRSVLNRVSATAVHPIEFGVVLACLFPLALHRTIHRWGQRLALVPTGLIFLGSFLAVSRSAMLCLGVVGVVLFVHWPPRWRLRALMLAPLSLVALRSGVPGLVGTIVSLFTNLWNDPSITGRTDDYGVVLDLYGDHPWLGRGLFTFVPRNYRILDNQWLMLLVEVGLVGLVVVALFLAVAYSAGMSAHRHAPDPRSRHLGLVLSAAVAGGAVSMVTFDAWGFPMAAGVAFLLAGLAGGARQLAREPVVPVVLHSVDGLAPVASQVVDDGVDHERVIGHEPV